MWRRYRGDLGDLEEATSGDRRPGIAARPVPRGRTQRRRRPQWTRAQTPTVSHTNHQHAGSCEQLSITRDWLAWISRRQRGDSHWFHSDHRGRRRRPLPRAREEPCRPTSTETASFIRPAKNLRTSEMCDPCCRCDSITWLKHHTPALDWSLFFRLESIASKIEPICTPRHLR